MSFCFSFIYDIPTNHELYRTCKRNKKEVKEIHKENARCVLLLKFSGKLVLSSVSLTESLPSTFGLKIIWTFHPANCLHRFFLFSVPTSMLSLTCLVKSLDCSTSLGNLFYYSVMLTVKNLFLMSNLHFKFQAIYLCFIALNFYK